MWAWIAFASLATLGAFVVLYGRSLLPQANAFKVLSQVDQHINDRIRSLTARIEARENRIPKPSPQPTNGTAEAPYSAELRGIFGGEAIEPVGEQPPADGIEIVD